MCRQSTKSKIFLSCELDNELRSSISPIYLLGPIIDDTDIHDSIEGRIMLGIFGIRICSPLLFVFAHFITWFARLAARIAIFIVVEMLWQCSEIDFSIKILYFEAVLLNTDGLLFIRRQPELRTVHLDFFWWMVNLIKQVLCSAHTLYYKASEDLVTCCQDSRFTIIINWS